MKLTVKVFCVIFSLAVMNSSYSISAPTPLSSFIFTAEAAVIWPILSVKRPVLAGANKESSILTNKILDASAAAPIVNAVRVVWSAMM